MSNGNGDDLRGSTPIYTAKDILVSLDRKVSEMDIKLDGVNTAIQIIVSQNLNERLVKLEARDQQWIGAQTAIRALFGTSVVSLIIASIAILGHLGVL